MPPPAIETEYTVPNYSEDVARQNPGSTYRRVRYIGIWNPPFGLPSVDVLEADTLIRDGAKEHLNEGSGGDAGGVIDQAEQGRQFQLRNPLTDELIPGQFATAAQVQVMLYSWARSRQELRDQRRSDAVAARKAEAEAAAAAAAARQPTTPKEPTP
ncbi:MAG: hypothetical protein L6R48_10855 [Planctomycetes bacterium]|nr:hypothetical protein [Planctomycetota bacterium]